MKYESKAIRIGWRERLRGGIEWLSLILQVAICAGLVAMIAKVGYAQWNNPTGMKWDDLKVPMVLLVVLLLLPSIKSFEGFGVKLEVIRKVDQKVDALSGSVRALPDYIQASDYLNEGDVSLAEEYFRRSLKQDENFSPAIISLGAIAQDQEDPDKAVRLYRQAWELGSSNVYAANNLADLYLELSNPAEALHWAELTLKEVPTMASALYYKAEAYNRLGRYQEALPVLAGILKKNELPGQRHWVLYEQAIALSNLDTPLSASTLEEILSAAPDKDTAREWLIQADLEKERFPKDDRITLNQFLGKRKPKPSASD